MNAEKWTEKEARHYRATARSCFEHSYDHGSTPDPDNCGGCAIRGHGTDDGKPNYCGWARCYVEAGYPIPEAWKADFETEMRSKNRLYANALARSIATFGQPVWKGKHPLHDARFVATCDESKIEVFDHGEEKGWRFEDPADSIICTMPDSPDQKANARLIAAAPDLLEACKAVLAWIQDHSDEDWRHDHAESERALESAIQKAEGAL